MNKYVRNLLGMVFQIQPTQQAVRIDPQPTPRSSEEWRKLWQSQGQPWRTEPEIDAKRQEELSKRRTIVPDIEKGIYPFKGVKLKRADIEWLLATHDNGRGPVDWNDASQRQTRNGLDLRGANLSGEDLSRLPLTRMLGGLRFDEWERATPEQRDWASIHLENCSLFWARLSQAKLRKAHLERADLGWAHLRGADLREAHLEEANLLRAHLEDAHLIGAHLEKVNLSEAHLDKARLENVTLSDEKRTGPRIVDVQLGYVNLTVVKWSQMEMLDDEYQARERTHDGKAKDKVTRLSEHERAVRANRQLAVALQSQGLNEDSTRFAYRAKCLERSVRWYEFLTTRSIWSRLQALGAWLFSWFLYLIAGYGYRLWFCLGWYVLVIVGFTMLYRLFEPGVFTWWTALGESVNVFHGRGAAPSVNELARPNLFAALTIGEAFIGLVIEIVLVATAIQRFFGK